MVLLLALLLFSGAVGLASAPSTEAWNNGMRWSADIPQAVEHNTTSDEWRYEFGLRVDSWGANTDNWTVRLLIGETVDTAPFTPIGALNFFDVENNGTNPAVSFFSDDVWLDVGTSYYLWGCARDYDLAPPITTPCGDGVDPGYLETFLSFTVLSTGGLFEFTPSTHPLALGLTQLGLQVDLSLFIIGIMPLAAISIVLYLADKRLKPERLFVPMVVIVSANIFLRFWPPIMAVFLFLFTGYLLMAPIIGRTRSRDGQPKEVQASQTPL